MCFSFYSCFQGLFFAQIVVQISFSARSDLDQLIRYTQLQKKLINDNQNQQSRIELLIIFYKKQTFNLKLVRLGQLLTLFILPQTKSSLFVYINLYLISNYIYIILKILFGNRTNYIPRAKNFLIDYSWIQLQPCGQLILIVVCTMCTRGQCGKTAHCLNFSIDFNLILLWNLFL